MGLKSNSNLAKNISIIPRLLWAVFVGQLILLAFVSYSLSAHWDENTEIISKGFKDPMVLSIGSMAILVWVLSFIIKEIFIRQAKALSGEIQLNDIQTSKVKKTPQSLFFLATMFSLVLCELTGLFGFTLAFVKEDFGIALPFYILAFIGIALHFPKNRLD